MADTLAVGFVGFGEAATCFAGALSGSADTEVRVYCNGPRNRPPYTPELTARLAALGAQPVDTLAGLVEASDVVFSAVVVAASRQVGLAIAEQVRPGQLVVDINASSPGEKRAIAEAVEQRGGAYVDASLMGAVSIYKHEVALYTSGTGARRFHDLFTPAGFNIEVASDEAGVSATVKTLRSVVTKGMEALIVEAMTAARRAGITDEAFQGICGPMDATTYSDFAAMCINTDVLHAGRRAAEMADAVAWLREIGMAPIMTEATVRRLQASDALGVREEFVDQPPTDYHRVLDAYERASRRQGGTPPATSSSSH